MDITNLTILIGFWLLGFFFLFRIPRSKRKDKESSLNPSVSIIIPARNEEQSLPILLASLKDQAFTPVEIIVVVDESSDKTKEIAEKEGVRIIQTGSRPKGWLGKPWACYQGAIVATGGILVFLDADTRVEKDGLRHIVQEYIEKDGVITIQPYHTMKKIYEQLSAFFNIIGMAGMGAFTVFRRKIKPVGLFGPCVVMERDQYFKVGGHSAVKGEVVEDLALGNKLKRQRTPIYCYGGKGTISFRMYPGGLKDLVDGWSKGFATGAVKTYYPVFIAIVLWIGGSISATRYTIEAIFNLNLLTLAGWSATYLLYSIQIYWMLFRLGSFKWYTALLYPISLLFFILVFLYSIFLIFIRRSVRWKGVQISLKDEGPTK